MSPSIENIFRVLEQYRGNSTQGVFAPRRGGGRGDGPRLPICTWALAWAWHEHGRAAGCGLAAAGCSRWEQEKARRLDRKKAGCSDEPRNPGPSWRRQDPRLAGQARVSLKCSLTQSAGGQASTQGHEGLENNHRHPQTSFMSPRQAEAEAVHVRGSRCSIPTVVSWRQ